MNNKVTAKIKELREASGMTQTELAERIGVSKSVVSAYEKGIRTPSFKVIREICRIFEIPESEFFADTGTESRILIDITNLTPNQHGIIYSLLNEFKEANDIRSNQKEI